MRYAIRSDMLTELSGKSPGHVRRVASWLLLPVCYLGVLISPAVLLAVPFQIFHKHQLSPLVFWGAAGLLGALVVWMLRLALVSWLRLFRQRVIYLEAGVLFTAVLLAVVAVLWVYPPR
jgi:hypothetical protein